MISLIDSANIELDFKRKRIRVNYLVVRGKKVPTDFEVELKDYPLISTEISELLGKISLEHIMKSLKEKEREKGNIKYIVTRLTELQKDILRIFYEQKREYLSIEEVIMFLTKAGHKINSARTIGGAIGSLNRIIKKYRNSKLIKIVKTNGKTVGFSIKNRNLLEEIVKSLE